MHPSHHSTLSRRGRHWLLAAACTLAGSLAVAAMASSPAPEKHGAAEAPPAAAHGEAPAHGAVEGSEGAPAGPAYKLGPPLAGKFDLSLLRASRRVADHRVALEPVEAKLGVEGNWQVRLEVTLEFGSESGLAESHAMMKKLDRDLKDLLRAHTGPALLTVAGKLHLKEDIIASLGARFETVRLRQAYFTRLEIVRT